MTTLHALKRSTGGTACQATMASEGDKRALQLRSVFGFGDGKAFLESGAKAPNVCRLLRVLVADDCLDTADSFGQLVKIWGHEVQVSYDGATALEAACACQPDVLLLDLGMPGMDGCRVARELRLQVHFKQTLLIALTSYTDEPHRRLAQEAGFDLFLIKPVDPLVLQKLFVFAEHRLENLTAWRNR